MMASDPAFLFYPNDFIGGTMGMTLEEKGAYMELLMAQFNRGHFSDLMATRIIGESLWAVLKQKFTADESGCYYNKRLEIEVNKRKAYSESRRNNLSGNKDKQLHMEEHMDTHMESHMATHMEAHMENRNSNRKIGGAGGKKTKKQSANGELQTEFEQYISAYCCGNTELEEALIDWLSMRIRLKDPITTMRALKSALKKLSSLGGNPVEHVERALVGNWKSFYSSNGYEQQTSKQTGGNQLDRLRAE